MNDIHVSSIWTHFMKKNKIMTIIAKSWPMKFVMFNLIKMSTLIKRMLVLIKSMGHEKHMVFFVFLKKTKVTIFTKC
jgi:hypothetical protein